MSKTSCIVEPANQPLLVLKQWQLDITGQDHCAAALISFFQYWHEIKMDNLGQSKKYNQVKERHGETPDIELGLLQFHTQEDLEKGLLGLFGITKIKECNKKLEKLGFISIHKNPSDRYKFDNTNYFLFHPKNIQNAISSLNFALVGNDQSLVGNDQPLVKYDQPVVRNDQTRTETTTETTKEITNIKKENLKPQKFDAEKYLEKLELDSEIKQNLKSWLEVRKAKRAATTQTAIDLQIKDLTQFSKEIQIKMIQNSIKNSWTGIFELKPVYQSANQIYNQQINPTKPKAGDDMSYYQKIDQDAKKRGEDVLGDYYKNLQKTLQKN